MTPDEAKELQFDWVWGISISDYERGYIAGLTDYAWWKDGTQYVGSCGKTLNEAVDAFLYNRGHVKTPVARISK